jgi:hypothetical protein
LAGPAALVAFLASDEAAFMCGPLVEITGAQPVARDVARPGEIDRIGRRP